MTTTTRFYYEDMIVLFQTGGFEMSLMIDLTPSEEARLFAAAKERGLGLNELVKKLVDEHLPVATVANADGLDARLRKWQEQDGVKLGPDIPTGSLFARWADEDAQMTHEERKAEDRLWEDLERELADLSNSKAVRAT